MKLSMISPLALVLAAGCASTSPSPELIEARRAYDAARTSQAASYTPSRVLEAKQALDRAERAHEESANSNEERSLAYVAQRRAELAVVYGNYELDQRNKKAAEQNYRVRSDSLRKNAEATAASSQQQLDSTRQNLASTRGQLAEAESRAAAAMASLEQVARVKEESRGTVITMDGSVLFVSGKAELLPIAQKKLDDVAKALNDVDESQKVVIEGHTDSNGDDAFNMTLSQQRADSVRTYLISRGVKAERITASGKGETQPLATNATPEGRANNRRVEIIIQKKSQ
jgi:outer membrane protein OmpA-like peptidoglycan-associated protein